MSAKPELPPGERGTSHRTFESYIDRTREFYGAQGYERPYRWAHHDDVPWAPLAKPLGDSRIALVTTASPLATAGSAQPKQVWSGAAESTPERLYTDDLAWDRDATTTDDVESFLPLGAFRELAAEGRIGSLAPRYHGVPTDYSQRRTREQDAPEILARCREDAADVVVFAPL